MADRNIIAALLNTTSFIKNNHYCIEQKTKGHAKSVEPSLHLAH